MNERIYKNVDELAKLCRDALSRGESIAVTGHDNPDADSIISCVLLQRLLHRLGVDAVIKLPTPPDNITLRDMKRLEIWKDEYLCRFCRHDRLLLVDHHKTFYNNEVIGCIDHHTTPPEADFDFNYVYAASSCGKMIFDMMSECGAMDQSDEVLALYSIFLDTQSCKSSKFDENDAPWVERCIEKYSLDREELIQMGYCLNSSLEDAATLAMYAYKRYEFNGKVSASNCVQIDERDENWNGVIMSLVKHLKGKIADEGYDLWIMVVNKPRIARSDLYIIHNDGRVQFAALDRLASRSKDVIPIVSSI